MKIIKKYFEFEKMSATFKKELIGGLATFFAMAYILSVNPGILSSAAGFKYQGALFMATAISAVIGTLIMAFVAKVPIAQAPGMGLNAFLAFTLTTQLKLSYGEAMAVTMISGLLYLIIAISPARSYIIKMMPRNMKLAIGAGIGLFLTLMGLENTGLIVADQATLVKVGSFKEPIVLVGLITLIVVFILHYLKVPGGILLGMAFGAILLTILIAANAFHAYSFKNEKVGVDFKFITSYHQIGKFGDLAAKGWSSFGSIWTKAGAYIGIFTFLYADFFDTTGSLIACDAQGKITQKTGSNKWIGKANIADATATMFGAGVGASTTTTFVESTVGISSGARTGFASIITAICFALAIAAWPIMPILMPIYTSNGKSFMPISGPILILVGTLMITQIRHFEWKKTIDIPAFLITIAFMAFGFSISAGISAGMITFTILNLAAGLLQKYTKLNILISEEEIALSDQISEDISNKKINYLKRINPVVIIVTILSIIFFIVYAFVQ